ncbi:DNA-processing protein DprA [Prosthecochloris sp.]|uniref:DNA-processing protein DprA n=1 Tax=Prosthecochloris sp. TaxID=290513 RepID=UPI00338F4AC5
MISDTTILLALSQIPGLGPARINILQKHIGGSSIFDAKIEDLAHVPGIGTKIAETIVGFFHNSHALDQAKKSAEQQLSLLDRYQANLITLEDPSYPPFLREIYDPPPYLFVRGDIKAAHAPCISIVGTRKATQYGRKVVEHICSDLVAEGFTIVSGFAYGIDTAAHKAALEHHGKTIAVLAGGVDNPHTDPTGNIWPRMIEQGAIVSEEWLESTITPAKFPKRNRLIAGLSKGTLIVESDKKGGSLITASYALDQNRDVFAVPGSIFSKTSAGTNALIENGQAKLVTTADDIIAELCPGPHGSRARNLVETKEPPITPEEKAIFDHLDDNPVHIDVLAEKTAMDPSMLLVLLFELELKQLAEQQPGQMFRKSI